MRRKSKITPAPATAGHCSPKESLQGFRADHELTQLLSRLPNKTVFIIRALRNEFSHTRTVTCPHCDGHGKILAAKEGKLRLVSNQN